MTHLMPQIELGRGYESVQAVRLVADHQEVGAQDGVLDSTPFDRGTSGLGEGAVRQ